MGQEGEGRREVETERQLRSPNPEDALARSVRASLRLSRQRIAAASSARRGYAHVGPGASRKRVPTRSADDTTPGRSPVVTDVTRWICGNVQPRPLNPRARKPWPGDVR